MGYRHHLHEILLYWKLASSPSLPSLCIQYYLHQYRLVGSYSTPKCRISNPILLSHFQPPQIIPALATGTTHLATEWHPVDIQHQLVICLVLITSLPLAWLDTPAHLIYFLSQTQSEPLLQGFPGSFHYTLVLSAKS